MKEHDHVDCKSGGAEHHPCAGAGRLRSKLEKAVYGNVVLLGVLSIVWLLLRSARKPSRLNYPCQRAALANTVLLFGGMTFPLAARIPRFITGERVERTWAKKLLKGLEVAGFATLVVLDGISVAGEVMGGCGRSME